MPEGEQRLSKAYAPVLAGLLQVLARKMDPAELRGLMREVGEELAVGHPAPKADRLAGARAAAMVLNELGGAVEVEHNNGELRLRGDGCPLAEAVRVNPEACRAVGALVSRVVGASVTEQCDHGDRPRCNFRIANPNPDQSIPAQNAESTRASHRGLYRDLREDRCSRSAPAAGLYQTERRTSPAACGRVPWG